MRLVKQASKQKRRTKTGTVKELGAKALGAAGLSFSLMIAIAAIRIERRRRRVGGGAFASGDMDRC